jgi:hypothetical protein
VQRKKGVMGSYGDGHHINDKITTNSHILNLLRIAKNNLR